MIARRINHYSAEFDFGNIRNINETTDQVLSVNTIQQRTS